MEQTSLLAYTQLRESGKLGERQHVVFMALRELGEASDMEISHHLGVADPNFVRPRRNELYKKFNLVEQAGKRHCHVTGKQVIIWKIRG